MTMHRGVLRKYTVGLSVTLRVSDAVACVAAALLAFILRFGSGSVFHYPGYPLLILIGVLLVLVVFPTTGLYGSWRTQRLLAPVVRVLFAWIAVFVILLVLLVVFKQSEHYSRGWMVEWFGLQAFFLIVVRLIIYGGLSELRRRGFNRREVVVVGTGRQARFLVNQIRKSVKTGFFIAAVFNGAEGSTAIRGIPVQPLAGLKEFLATRSIDEIWITLSLEQSQKLRGVLTQLQDCTANVRYVLDLEDLYLLNHGVTDILGTPMIDLMSSPLQGPNRVVKAVEDRLLAAIILILISPLMMLIAISVKLGSPGPIMFRQRRHGWDGREIVVYKFRTMYLHQEDQGYVTQAVRDDARITRLGAFLRGTSLDELPQFINVLQGRMSVVGPRPHAIEHNNQYKRVISRYMLRHVVKPGITGWAQVNGWRGETDTEEKMRQRVKYDLYYIDNWSLWFDIKIVFLTLFKGFTNKNAY